MMVVIVGGDVVNVVKWWCMVEMIVGGDCGCW